MNPHIGQTVHYTVGGGQANLDSTEQLPTHCRAAIITELSDPNTLDPRLMSGPFPHMTVGLMVANPTGQFFHALDNGGVQWDPLYSGHGFIPGTWHHLHDMDD